MGQVNALNQFWCETSLLPQFHQAVLKHVVSRGFILNKLVHGTSSVFCQKRRNYMALLFDIRIFPCHFTSLQKKLNYGTWVTNGLHASHIQLLVKSINKCDLLLTLVMTIHSYHAALPVGMSGNPPLKFTAS